MGPLGGRATIPRAPQKPQPLTAVPFGPHSSPSEKTGTGPLRGQGSACKHPQLKPACCPPAGSQVLVSSPSTMCTERLHFGAQNLLRTFPPRAPLTWARCPGPPADPSPVLVIAGLLEAGKLQPMYHTGLKQKLGGPEAQSSCHKGHGCHSKG